MEFINKYLTGSIDGNEFYLHRDRQLGNLRLLYVDDNKESMVHTHTHIPHMIFSYPSALHQY